MCRVGVATINVATMDTAIAGGAEERLSSCVQELLRRSFAAFAERAAAAWRSASTG